MDTQGVHDSRTRRDRGVAAPGKRPELPIQIKRHFEMVYKRAYQAVRPYADHATAEEVAQEVGERFWEAVQFEGQSFPNEASIRGWTARAARNRLFDKGKAAERRAERDFAFDEMREEVRQEWIGAEEEREAGALDRVIREALAGVSKASREIFLAVREEGCSIEEVAAARGITRDGVNYHLKRAAMAVRVAVAKYQSTRETRDGGGAE